MTRAACCPNCGGVSTITQIADLATKDESDESILVVLCPKCQAEFHSPGTFEYYWSFGTTTEESD